MLPTLGNASSFLGELIFGKLRVLFMLRFFGANEGREEVGVKKEGSLLLLNNENKNKAKTFHKT